jgi:DNA-binding transcriptional ArsR family regulator
MELSEAASALSALGHQPRLEVFRLLVQAGSNGMAAGDIARATGARSNTLSSNLGILSTAGLITGRREGRSIFYAARYDRIGSLLAFLVEDCCGGSPEICAPAVAGLKPVRC